MTPNDDAPLTLNVHFHAAPGQEEELKRTLMGLLEPTRKESGCLGYVLHFDPKDASRFMLYENWSSQAALDRHFEMEYLKDLVNRAGVLLAEPMAMTKWRKLGGD